MADDEDVPADIVMLGGGIVSEDSTQKDEKISVKPLLQKEKQAADDTINFDDQAKCFL